MRAMEHPASPVPSYTILCVDDDPAARALMSRLLTRHGYRVMQASNIRGALDTLQRDRSCSLIVVDLNMPEYTGFDLIKLLKADPLTREIPVMVVSNSALPDAEQRAKELGAAEYIGSPIEDTAIIAAVHRALGPRDQAH